MMTDQPHLKQKRGRTLLVLMWKHYTVRKRRYFVTAFEYISPLSFLLLLYITKDELAGELPGDTRSNICEVSAPVNISLFPGPLFIFYYPENVLTSTLMTKVGKSLLLNRLKTCNDDTPGYYGSNDLNFIDSIFRKFGENTHAFVLFKNMNGVAFPDRLEYTIRMKGDFHTETYRSSYGGLRPNPIFINEYTTFVRLQWAIDSMFLELRTGHTIEQSIFVQEFPYTLTRVVPRKTEMMTIAVIVMIFLGVLVCLCLVFNFLMARLMEERSSGMQELIKMVGVTTQTLGFSHFLNVLPGGLMFSIIGPVLLTTGGVALMEYSSGFLIGVFFFLHFLSVVALAFACSFITNNTEHTVALPTLLYFGLLVPPIIMIGKKIPNSLIPLVGMLPFMPAMLFFKEAFVLELRGKGITFETFMESYAQNSCSVLAVYDFLILQTVLFFVLSWYLSLVRPRKHGTVLPWNFLCQKKYWSRSTVHPAAVDDVEIDKLEHRDPNYFEKHPPNSEVGIDIQNVTKVFKGFVALNLSLQVLKEEITVLLGHNGAGKTTLMSIITGEIAATTGKVYVNGLDTVTQQTAVRSQLGFCPQHNLFFSELTVFEHVKFFSLIKGTMPWKQSQQSSDDLLMRLGLTEKAKSLSSELSGGMKRRLQLACALAGDANVLVLDEPTAGLDVETRRSLWDLLLSLRAGRTVLMSTHFMEEADALGDRIAALHSGTLRCDATPMLLKKEIDTGYTLTITQNVDQTASSEDEISKIITSVVPQATLQPAAGNNTLIYKLPSRDCDKFSGLFKNLENNRERFGIDSMSVGASTIEEVFLKLCSNTIVAEDVDIVTLQDDSTPSKITGSKLILSQFVVLFVRQIRFVLSSWLGFGIMQVILPILLLFWFTYATNGGRDYEDNPESQMNLNMYRDKNENQALSNFDIPLDDRPACCGVNYRNSDNITQSLLQKDESEYYKYIIGITLKPDKAIAHFSTVVRHAMPVSVNALSNAIASTLPLENPRTTINITTFNHPLKDDKKIQPPKTSSEIFLWAIAITFLIQTTLLKVLSLPGAERVGSTRRIHLMAGCSPELYWLVAFVFHAMYSVLVLVIPTVLFAATVDKEDTFSQTDFLFPLALLLLGACLASIALAFLISFFMSYKHAATALVAAFFVLCILFPSAKEICENFVKERPVCKAATTLLDTVAFIVMPNTFLEAMHRNAIVARMNAFCYLNKHLCPELAVPDEAFDKAKCCESHEPPRCYFCFDKYSPFPLIISLYIQGLILMVMVILTERGIVGRLRDRIMNGSYDAKRPTLEDTLEKEKLYVEQSLKNPRGDAMLVSSVHKNYKNICMKDVTAVRGVSFAVREGECFGLVGVNGAGKSTTFKMMTCETFPTRGTLVANGQPQRTFDNSKFLNELGYCPQFFGLDDFLTGRQNLELLITLQGLEKKDAQVEAVHWLELIDLMRYADRKVKAYSGGCCRRLNSVAALARRATLSLLDEPTAGVDVAARRQLWKAVRAAQAQTTLNGRRRAVLITSHSMDEMEALCSRVAILSAGRLAALGAPAALRAAHHAGLALFIKLKYGNDQVTDAENPELQKLKQACLDYQWTLKDVHKTMLNYHVDKSLKMEYSELFAKLEALRRSFPDLIEDYAVTSTTLEEVFLSYASHNNQATA